MSAHRRFDSVIRPSLESPGAIPVTRESRSHRRGNVRTHIMDGAGQVSLNCPTCHHRLIGDGTGLRNQNSAGPNPAGDTKCAGSLCRNGYASIGTDD